jgi:hypothetical protein
MIKHTRTNEEVILHSNVLDISPEEIEKTSLFLESEYKQECLSYPYTAPEFDVQAAIWAARLFYISSQLLLYREQNIEEINKLLPPYNSEITASAILSADLTLRFIPHIVTELKLIDDTDPLIETLESYLHLWHYSAIGYSLPNIDKLDFKILETDKCLNQLYINRIIEKNAISLSKHPALHSAIESTLGMYKKELWEGFE